MKPTPEGFLDDLFVEELQRNGREDNAPDYVWAKRLEPCPFKCGADVIIAFEVLSHPDEAPRHVVLAATRKVYVTIDRTTELADRGVIVRQRFGRYVARRRYAIANNRQSYFLEHRCNGVQNVRVA